MARKTVRHTKYPRGRTTRVRETVGLKATSLYAWLLTSELLGSLPGVLLIGPGAIAERLRISTAEAKRLLRELEQNGWVVVDYDRLLVFVLHAIADDPAANPNVVEFSWFPRVRELPASPVTDRIVHEITETLRHGHADTFAKWCQLRDGIPNDRWEPLPPRVEETVGGIPSPSPSPDPQPVPQPPPLPEDLAPYLEAAERLGSPFDYAAAAARLSLDRQKQWIQIPIDEWGLTLQGLAASFYAGDRARKRPTLIDLIENAQLRQRQIEWLDQEVGRKWHCAICTLDHPILEVCPAECGDCYRRHYPEPICASTRLRLERERAEAERAAADEREQAEAAAAGVSVDELRAQRKAAWWKPTPGGLRASLSASRATDGGKAA